ncbi:hypothetical protein PHBOTO_005468 [Pseudozyma hubeiensis]|nr:hypothetical protein PHBOTO_005468 [Pseudozyma hubeiensis]
MTDQSRWSSTRVAQARSAEQQPTARTGQTSTNGTQQSRWATNTSTASSSSNASSSSWRARPDDRTTSPSSSSAWRAPPRAAPTNRAAGSSTSRWASASSSSAASPDPSISSLTDSLSRTSIAHGPQTASPHTKPAPVSRPDGLTVRDASRPLGNKSLDRLALLASPSRGLDSISLLSTTLSDQGSMDLTSFSVQHELRQYISTRITTKAIPLLTSPPKVLTSSHYLLPSPKEPVGEGEEELQQILLLVRKLREALVASKRADGFAVEVYECSVYLSLLCGDIMQLASSLPRLVLDLYPSTTVEEQTSNEDLHQLSKHLGLESLAKGNDKRQRLISLYLLQILCLSGRATRLGQYSKEDSSGAILQPLHRGLREYKIVKEKVEEVHGDLGGCGRMCDRVYAALRDVDPFALARVLEGGGVGRYEVDGWQRLILLQVVGGMRNAAWGVVKRAYMYLPVGEAVKGMIEGGEAEERAAGSDLEESERFLGELLLLNTNVLPAESSYEDAKQDAKPQETPDSWDAEDQPPPPPALDRNQRENDLRLYAFLTHQFGSTLPTRLTSLKTGHAVKLR